LNIGKNSLLKIDWLKILFSCFVFVFAIGKHNIASPITKGVAQSRPPPKSNVILHC